MTTKNKDKKGRPVRLVDIMEDLPKPLTKSEFLNLKKKASSKKKPK